MTQQAKKTAHHTQAKPTVTLKAAKSAQNNVRSGHKTQEVLFKMENESIKDMKNAADNSNHVAMEYGDICSDNVSALVESCGAVPRVLSEAGNDVMESLNQSFSNLTEISKEAFSCRTISNMFELQNKILLQTYDDYLSMTNKLYDLLFNYCAKTPYTISDRTTVSSGHLGKTQVA